MLTLVDIVAVIALIAMAITVWKVGTAVERSIRNMEESSIEDAKGTAKEEETKK